MTVIDKMRSIALKMQWFKPIALVLIVVSIGLFGYIIFADSGIAKDDQYLYPSVLLLMWSLSTGAFVHTFANVPEPASKELGFFKRVGIGFKRFYYYIVGLATVGLTAALLFASFRAIRLFNS